MNKITGVILAGGLGRRMGGVDKGLQPFDGKPLVEHVLQRFAPQVDELLINANRNTETYARLSYPVLSDEIGGFAGPLAGMHAALTHAHHELVACVPCDSPFLPTDLVARLADALTTHQADVAMAVTGEQTHPVFCLCRRSLLPTLTAYLESGRRSFIGWIETQTHIGTPFDDQAEAFCNLNTVPYESAGFHVLK